MSVVARSAVTTAGRCWSACRRAGRSTCRSAGGRARGRQGARGLGQVPDTADAIAVRVASGLVAGEVVERDVLEDHLARTIRARDRLEVGGAETGSDGDLTAGGECERGPVAQARVDLTVTRVGCVLVERVQAHAIGANEIARGRDSHGRARRGLA